MRFPISVLAIGICFTSPCLAQPIVVTADPNGSNIRDTTGDGLGNAVQAPGVSLMYVGEVVADSDQARPFLAFVLTAEQRQAVAEGGRVELSISYGASSRISNLDVAGTPTDLRVDIYGFLNRETEIPAAADYENQNVLPLHTGAFAPGVATGKRIFDVTDFAKVQSGLGSVVAFRLQLDPPDVLPFADGNLNRYLLHSHANANPALHPTLTIHPPASTITAGSDQHRNLADTTGDGLGDWIDSGADTLGRVGESPTQDASQSRWYLPFELQGSDIESVTDADLVTLNLFFGIRTAVNGLMLGENLSIELNESGEGRNITDTTGDGQGNAVKGVDTLIRVGEHAVDFDQSRYFMPFVLSAEERDLVANGGRVNLAFSLGIGTNLQGLDTGEETIDLNLDVYGYVGRETDIPQAADYHDPNVELLHSSALTPASPGGIHVFDVTDFVQAQSALGQTVAFRLQIGRAEALPFSDGVLNRYLLHGLAHATAPAPKLEIFPEWPVPATDLKVEIVGFTNRTTLPATEADYHSSDVEVLFAPAEGLDQTGYFSFNVTDFVKQEVAAGSILAFRLQIDQPEALPLADGVWNRYLFHSPNNGSGNRPFLEVVDELPFNAWRKTQFLPGELEIAALSGPFADADGDNITNLMEFALTGDPRQPDRGILPLNDFKEVEGADYLTLRFTRLEEVFDIEYVVEGTDELGFWDESTAVLEESINHDDGTVTETYRSVFPVADETRGFLRLRVNQLY